MEHADVAAHAPSLMREHDPRHAIEGRAVERVAPSVLTVAARRAEIGGRLVDRVHRATSPGASANVFVIDTAIVLPAFVRVPHGLSAHIARIVLPATRTRATRLRHETPEK